MAAGARIYIVRSVTWLALTLICIALVAGVVAERAVGMGLSLVAAPMLVVAIGPVDAVRLLVLLALPINLGNTLLMRRSVNAREVIRIAIPALLLMPVFAFAVEHAPRAALTILAGLACVTAAAVIASGSSVRGLDGTGGAIAAGAGSAALNAIAGLSGPPVALYAANAGWQRDHLRANLQAYFLLLDLVAIPSLGLPHLAPEGAVAATVSAAAGFAVGALIAGRISERGVRWAVLAASAAGGLSAVGFGLLSLLA
ncbi:MAG TPA: TSUP family transporter [Candidatus Sulfotelmatobacter sp.]|nr:TSUP family transporter [Candidatus Sulfotelmatobacter sp.]